MTRDTTHSTKGSSIVRALVAAVLVASMFGLSTLAASAQDASWLDSGELDVPTPLEICEEQFPDAIVDTGPIVEEALADSDLPPELVEEIVASSSFTLTCDDLFGGDDV